MPKPWFCAVALLLCAQAASAHAGHCAPMYAETATAAHQFLASLDAAQRQAAVFPLESEERYDFHFIPRARKGLPYRDMTPAQRGLAQAFLQSVLSQRGLLQAQHIIELELVLREMGQNPAVRDPELYFFTFFGEPAEGKAWGFRFEGHHLSLNGTVAGCARMTVTPTFLGANPAHVKSGSQKGRRALALKEDLGRELVRSLDEAQRKTALLEGAAPPDILTGTLRRVSPLEPRGLAAAALSQPQQALLRQLVMHYLQTYRAEVAAAEWEEIEEAGWEHVHFAWAGPTEPGRPHYYRVQGPTFLLEYDNTQNDANHIHTVWRNFKNDFGEDALKRHYEEYHR
jgi:hypothetical protein